MDPNYEEMTVPELKDLAEKRGVELLSDARKAEIIAALEASDLLLHPPEEKQSVPRTAPESADAEVTGAGSPACNGSYTNVNFGDHYDGPGGLKIEYVPDYPAPGDLTFAITDASSRIYYTGPDGNMYISPWDAPWQVGSFGAAPAPQVTQAPDVVLNEYQMSSTVTAELHPAHFAKIKLST